MDTTYDGAGNVVLDADQRAYTWDPLGMMTSATVDGRTFRYLYNADNERIAAVERVPVGAALRNRTTFTLRGSGNQLLSTWIDDWTSGVRLFTRKEDTIWRDSQLLARAYGTNTMNYTLDHLGSPRLITNSAGAVLDQQNFEPFGGGGLYGSGALQFTGHERDQANLGGGSINLPDYFHARFYDKAGRFLSVDPAKSAKPAIPQSWNRYSYAINNPLKYVDRTGQYYELASTADRQFFVDAITRGTNNRAARELIVRQAADPLHKIGLATGNLQGRFTFGDSSRLHAPYRTVAGNLFPSGITSTIDKGKLAMTNYPTPTITVFHELKHDDVILNQGMAANARQPDTTTLNTTTGQVTTNSIFEDFGRAAATTADDPMHALSADSVSKLIADPGEGKARSVSPCESEPLLCIGGN